MREPSCRKLVTAGHWTVCSKGWRPLLAFHATCHKRAKAWSCARHRLCAERIQPPEHKHPGLHCMLPCMPAAICSALATTSVAQHTAWNRELAVSRMSSIRCGRRRRAERWRPSATRKDNRTTANNIQSGEADRQRPGDRKRPSRAYGGEDVDPPHVCVRVRVQRRHPCHTQLWCGSTNHSTWAKGRPEQAPEY